MPRRKSTGWQATKIRKPGRAGIPRIMARAGMRQHLPQRRRVNRAGDPNPCTPDLYFNGAIRHRLRCSLAWTFRGHRRGRGILRNSERHEANWGRRALLAGLAPPRTKARRGSPHAGVQHPTPSRQDGSSRQQSAPFLRRPLPPPRITRDQLYSTIRVAFMTVIMTVIRTSISHCTRLRCSADAELRRFHVAPRGGLLASVTS